VNEEQWIKYVNKHIDPGSDLKRLAAEDLERWARLRLIVPSEGEYHRTDLERTLSLLMLERALVAKLWAGEAIDD